MQLWAGSIVDISGLTAKMDFRCEIGRNEARTQQTAKGDALKRGKEVVAVLPLTMSSPATQTLLQWLCRRQVLSRWLLLRLCYVLIIAAQFFHPGERRRHVYSSRAPRQKISPMSRAHHSPSSVVGDYGFKMTPSFFLFLKVCGLSDIIVFPRKCWVILTYWPLLIRSDHVILFSPSGWSGRMCFWINNLPKQ